MASSKSGLRAASGRLRRSHMRTTRVNVNPGCNTILRVPKLERAIFAPRYNGSASAHRVDSHAIHVLSMTIQFVNRLRACDIMHASQPIPSHGHNSLHIGRKRRWSDIAHQKLCSESRIGRREALPQRAEAGRWCIVHHALDKLRDDVIVLLEQPQPPPPIETRAVVDMKRESAMPPTARGR